MTLTGAENQLQASDLKTLHPITELSVSQSALGAVLRLKIDGDFSYSDKILPGPDYRFELRIQSLAEQHKESIAGKPPAENKLTVVKPRVSRNEAAKPPQAVVSPPTPKQTEQQVVRNAKQLLRKGRPFEAEQLLMGFLKKQPQALNSAKMLMTLWLSQQRYEPLSPLLNRLRASHSNDVDLLVIQARLYLAKSQAGQAVDLLMTAQPDIGRHSDYYELLALAARKNQQYQLSEQAYRGLVDSDALRGDWWVGLGIALDAQGKLANARRAYKQGLKTKHISEPLRDYAQQRLLD